MGRVGEHTVMMLSALASEEVEGTDWLHHFVADFRHRFRALLTIDAFRQLSPVLALSILDPRLSWEDAPSPSPASSVCKADGSPFSVDDLNRLEVGPCKVSCWFLCLSAFPS
jgi:N-acetyltransferase 10